MLKRHLTVPFRHVCVTDNPTKIDKEVRTVPLWDDPEVEMNAHKINSYRRLKMFSREAKELLGEKILSLDLDTIITGNIDHLVNRDEDFIAWHKGLLPYQGGIILHKPGSRAFIWDEFDPVESPKRAAMYPGSDQAWISYRLGRDEETWTKADGIYSYKQDLRGVSFLDSKVKIVMFHGNPKPWQIKERWAGEHYR